MRCIATHNIYGYRLAKQCVDPDPNSPSHRATVDSTINESWHVSNKVKCSCHTPIEDDFELWVQEVRGGQMSGEI